jgi:hypothetical protein
MVCIWEEKEATKWSKKAAIKIAANSGNKKIPVNDVKFAPHNFGLKIATPSGDGSTRIHEAPDIFDLTKWDLLVGWPMSMIACTIIRIQSVL